VAPPGELFDWMSPEDRPSAGMQARPAARKRVALPYAAPLRAPVVLTDGDGSDSDGEDFNVPDEASERRWTSWIWGLSTATHWLPPRSTVGPRVTVTPGGLGCLKVCAKAGFGRL
jgi:hypothetical protein